MHNFNERRLCIHLKERKRVPATEENLKISSGHFAPLRFMLSSYKGGRLQYQIRSGDKTTPACLRGSDADHELQRLQFRSGQGTFAACHFPFFSLPCFLSSLFESNRVRNNPELKLLWKDQAQCMNMEVWWLWAMLWSYEEDLYDLLTDLWTSILDKHQRFCHPCEECVSTVRMMSVCFDLNELRLWKEVTWHILANCVWE